MFSNFVFGKICRERRLQATLSEFYSEDAGSCVLNGPKDNGPETSDAGHSKDRVRSLASLPVDHHPCRRIVADFESSHEQFFRWHGDSTQQPVRMSS